MEKEMKELDALLEYLIGHNKDHAGEIMELAEKADRNGLVSVRDKLTQGVGALEESNRLLEEALLELRGND